MELKTINPTTEELIEVYPELTPAELEQKLINAQEAYYNWRDISFEDKAELLWQVADLLCERTEKYAQLITQEMGKPLMQAREEIAKCCFVCRYYAENAGSFLASEYVETYHLESYISYRPLGVLLAIMPWNFPFWQVLRFAAPYLMTGNTCVLKHSNNTTGCALAIEELFLDAGVPENVFTSLIIDVDKVESVIKNPIVKGITLTGSIRVGKIVAAQAADVMKKCVFELGGSDPYLILDDADLINAAEVIVNARFNNSGQTCISPKRIIATRKTVDELTQQLLHYASFWDCADPMADIPFRMGPLARKDLLDGFNSQIQRTIAAGAECLMGGAVQEGRGYFYKPTIFHRVNKSNPAYNEEFFGPSICIITAESEHDMIRIANDSSFGLGAAVFSSDIAHAKHIAEYQLNAGATAINCIVKSDPRLPFGGIGESGYGREIGLHGIREFMNIKTVSVG